MSVCVCVCVANIPKRQQLFLHVEGESVENNRHLKPSWPYIAVTTVPPLHHYVDDITIWFKGHLPLHPHFLFR